MTKKMNNEKMIRSCRTAMSSLAGVDNRTMKEVAEMKMRSDSAAVSHDVVDCLMSERSAASSDYRF